MNKVLSIVGLLGLGGLGGCGLTASELSCTQMENGAPKQCIEYTDFDTFSGANSKARLQIVCRGFGVEPVEGRCNTTNAAAGCQKVRDNAWTQVTWTYKSMTVKTEADVSCSSSDTKLRADRTAVPK